MSSIIKEDWFVAKTRYCQEMSIKARLVELGITHFLPTKKVKRKSASAEYVEVPIIPNLIFIRTTKALALSLVNGYSLPMWYMIDRSTNTLLVVPEKQMDDFRQIYEIMPESICSSDLNLTIGERVRITKGQLKGIEGNVVKLPNKTYVVVSLRLSDGSSSLPLLMSRIQIPRHYLEII